VRRRDGGRDASSDVVGGAGREMQVVECQKIWTVLGGQDLRALLATFAFAGSGGGLGPNCQCGFGSGLGELRIFNPVR
jgi:hypothetical protein